MGKEGRSAHDQLHWQQQLAQFVTSAAEQVCSSTSLQGSFLPRLPGQYSRQQSLQHTFRAQPAASGRVLVCQIQPRALQARRLRSQPLPDIADAQQPDEPSGNERILVSEVQHWSKNLRQCVVLLEGPAGLCAGRSLSQGTLADSAIHLFRAEMMTLLCWPGGSQGCGGGAA